MIEHKDDHIESIEAARNKSANTNLSIDKQNHILNGSRGKNHHWDELVLGKNWEVVAQIIAEVMVEGDEVTYKICGHSKEMKIGECNVVVTYAVVGEKTMISDAWVVAPESKP